MSTPLQGGAIHRLPALPSVENLKKQAKRMAKNQPSRSLQQVQHALAKSYGYPNWDGLLIAIQSERQIAGHGFPKLVESGVFAPYRKIAFVEKGPGADDDFAVAPELAAPRFEVAAVYGTSPDVAVGERYCVMGRFELAGAVPHTLSLAVFERCMGGDAYLQPGAGRFSITTEILKLTPGSPNGIAFVVGNEKTGKANMVRWLIFPDGRKKVVR